MKKTVTVTLNGRKFELDEDAFHALERYLKMLEEHFKDDPDRKEIINDIEDRIAEHFSASVTVPEQVISYDTVMKVIGIMGMPGDFDQEAGNENTNTAPPYKKLYRDIDNRIISGICSGMGQYWNVDPVIFRIIFIFSILWGGLGIIIYLVLSLVIPIAITPAQKLEMRGEKVTAENIRKTYFNQKH